MPDTTIHALKVQEDIQNVIKYLDFIKLWADKDQHSWWEVQTYDYIMKLALDLLGVAVKAKADVEVYRAIERERTEI